MDSIPNENMSNYLNWDHKVDVINARSTADVAILFSGLSRDFTKGYASVPEGLGMSQMMNDAQIQHDVLLDSDLRLDRLRPYKLVILASIPCMSRASVEALRQYVKEGGKLLASGHSSLQNEDGVIQKNFQLAELFGVDIDPSHMSFKGKHILKMRGNKVRAEVPLSAFRVMPRKTAEIQILADLIQNGKVLGPAVVTNRFGKGLSTYLASPLGQTNLEREVSRGDEWKFQMNRLVADCFLKILRDGVPGGFDLEAVSVPERVFISVHRQSHHKEAQILVHLLNMKGSGKLELGQKVPRHPPKVPFPKIQKNIVFDIRLGSISSGYVVSPDYKGKKEITLSKRDKGYTRVSINKDDLQAYSIVYLKLE